MSEENPTYEELIIENEYLKNILSEKTNFENSLVEKNELLSLFIKESPVYAFIKDVTDTESKVIYASENYENMIGVKGSDMVGKNMHELFPKEFADKFTADDYTVVTQGKVLHLDEDMNNRNYTTIKFPINIGGKQLLAGYTIDITDRKKIEEDIKNKNIELNNLNNNKDKFISILAHDLKSPFNSLLGFSDLLLDNVHKYDTEKIKDQLIIIRRAINQAYILLEDLLIWSKTQAGKLPFEQEPVKFTDTCQEVLGQMKCQADTKNINLYYFESESIILNADKNMLKTILRNLLSNAIKFSNHNSEIKLFSLKKDNNAVITVSDKGNGLSPEKQDALWSNNYSLAGSDNDMNRNGFGLVLCKEFVEKHGGKIWVETKPGKGSDFKFTLPLYKGY